MSSLTKSQNKLATLELQQGLAIFANVLFVFSLPIILVSYELVEALTMIFATLPSLLLFTFTFSQPKERFDIFHPINFILLSVFIGTTVRSYYMFTTTNLDHREGFFKGEHNDFFLLASIVIFISFVFFLIGYNQRVKPLRVIKSASIFSAEWNKKRLWFVVIIFTILSVIGVGLFLSKMGVTELTADNFSAKRKITADDGFGFKKISHGYYRWLGSVGKIALYILLVDFLRSKRSFLTVSGVMVIALFIFAILFPLINNSKSGIGYIVLTCVMIWTYYRGFPKTAILFGLPIIFSLFGVIQSYRQQNLKGRSNTVINTESSKIAAGISEMLRTNNMLDLSKTAHILHRVPQKTGHVYGTSYISLLAAPIPRTLWANKPSIYPGKIIRRDVFLEADASRLGGGIPPAMIGELYWNFSWPGIFIGMFLFGRFTKVFYSTMRPLLGVNINALLVYVSVVISLSFVMVGSDFNHGLLTAAMNIIPIFVAIMFIKK